MQSESPSRKSELYFVNLQMSESETQRRGQYMKRLD